jgi:hypothetical protein
MARPLRINYEGAFHHITARGNERRKIFLSKADYDKFLTLLTDASLLVLLPIPSFITVLYPRMSHCNR